MSKSTYQKVVEVIGDSHPSFVRDIVEDRDRADKAFEKLIDVLDNGAGQILSYYDSTAEFESDPHGLISFVGVSEPKLFSGHFFEQTFDVYVLNEEDDGNDYDYLRTVQKTIMDIHGEFYEPGSSVDLLYLDDLRNLTPVANFDYNNHVSRDPGLWSINGAEPVQMQLYSRDSNNAVLTDITQEEIQKWNYILGSSRFDLSEADFPVYFPAFPDFGEGEEFTVTTAEEIIDFNWNTLPGNISVYKVSIPDVGERTLVHSHVNVS